MNSKTVARKKRTDRTHIIYMIESGADFYIGVTAKTMSTVKKSVLVRCNKHMKPCESVAQTLLRCVW
jgi:hypothetical protein